MSSLREHIDRFELVELMASWNEELQCEAVDHADPAWSHVHAGPAAYLCILPCGQRALLCARIVGELRAKGGTSCTRCYAHPTAHVKFIEL